CPPRSTLFPYTTLFRSLVGELPMEKGILDGEVVVLAENGSTSFADLQAAFQEGVKKALTYFVFDLLHLNGHSTRDLSLIERKKRSEEHTSELQSPYDLV